MAVQEIDHAKCAQFVSKVVPDLLGWERSFRAGKYSTIYTGEPLLLPMFRLLYREIRKLTVIYHQNDSEYLSFDLAWKVLQLVTRCWHLYNRGQHRVTDALL